MKDTAQKGFVGVIFPIVGTITSLLPQLEIWLRVASLIVGIAVGLASFVSIIRRWNKSDRK